MNINPMIKIDLWRLQVALEQLRKSPNRPMAVKASIFGGQFIEASDIPSRKAR